MSENKKGIKNELHHLTNIASIDSFGLKTEIWKHFFTWEKFKRISISLAALTGLMVSAEELWLTSQNSVFLNIKLCPFGLIFLGLLSFFLFILYSIEWNRKTDQKVTFSSCVYAIVCLFGNVGIMFLTTVFVHLVIGSLNFGNLSNMWMLLYVAFPFSLGEFALTSIASRQLQKAKELEEKVKRTVEQLDNTMKNFKELYIKELISDELRDDYWKNYLQKRMENKEMKANE